MQTILSFDASGVGHCLWNEAVPLAEIGTLTVERASSVEFNPATQQWEVRWPDSPSVVFSHASRAECIRWEIETLNERLP